MSYLDLISLPDIVLEKILLYLSYDEIAQLRIVCKRLDTVCKQLLNKGFNAVERYHLQCIKVVKEQLPRRESERRLHPLAHHYKILTAIETRLSMLSMTFMKYVDVGLCCFIPGKVIDELFRVLRFLKECKTAPQAHELLQELRDISFMATEHFDEKIAPGLKNNRAERYSNNYCSEYSSPTSLEVCPSRPQSYFTFDLKSEFEKTLRRHQKNKREIQSFHNKIIKHKSHINAQGKKITGHTHLLAEHDTQIAEMKRTMAEMDHKIQDLVAELCYVREENKVLAGALGIVFNKNPADVSSLAWPSSSHDISKRKLNDIDMMKIVKKCKAQEGCSVLVEKLSDSVRLNQPSHAFIEDSNKVESALGTSDESDIFISELCRNEPCN